MNASRRQFIQGLSLALLAQVAPATGPVRNRQWLAYTYQGSDAPGNAARLEAAAREISLWSQGSLQIGFHLGNTLDIKVSDIVRACGSGAIQLADETFFLNTLLGGSFLQLPLLITSAEEYQRVIAVVEPGIIRAYEAAGCEVLGRYDFASVHIFGSGTTPITSLDDLRGRRLRTGRDVHNEFLALYGARPSLILTPDVMAAFEAGSLDGALTSFAAGGSVWRKYLTSVLLMSLYNSQGYFIANRAALQSLHPEQRQYIRTLFRAEARKTTAIMRADEDRVIEEFKRKGMVFSRLSDSQTRDARAKASIVWERWARSRGPEAVDLLASVRRQLGG